MNYKNVDITRHDLRRLEFGSDVRAKSSGTLNPDTSSATGTLDKDVLVQIVEVVNIAKSLSEREQLANSDKNHVLVDTVRATKMIQRQQESSEETVQDPSYRLYKLTLQDAKGNLIYAFEAVPLPFLRPPVPNQGIDPLNGLPRGPVPKSPVKLGSKLLVHRGTRHSLGVLMLYPHHITFLGGSIDAMN